MIDASTLDRCRSLALAVAPELESRRLRVVNAEDLAGLPLPQDFMGLAFDRAVEWLPIAERIGPGTGAVIALDGPKIKEAATPGNFLPCLHNVVIHETAHLVPAIADVTPVFAEPREETKALQLAIMHRRLERPEPQPGHERDTHDLAYIRRSIHLYVRALACGYDVPLRNLFGLWYSHETAYLEVLLPEVLRMHDRTFAEIENTEPPAALRELWQKDLAFHDMINERHK